MAKTPAARSYDDVLSLLGTHKFDVAGASGGGAVRVSKYGCAAEMAPAPSQGKKELPGESHVSLVTRPGVLLGSKISRLLDRGYQKFLRTDALEIPATAAHLRALHDFTNELYAATGEINHYNESLGTTSNRYEYDRVLGRPDQPVR